VGLQDLFFELIQVAVGTRDELSRVPTAKEWIAMYEESEKQSIVGVMLDGLERLSDTERPPQEILLQWIGMSQMTEQDTKRIKEASEESIKFFHENGFACSLLKGVAVGRYYPNPMRRQSGDVDIWLDGGRKKIYDFARSFLAEFQGFLTFSFKMEIVYPVNPAIFRHFRNIY
jgi:hypothetical protein